MTEVDIPVTVADEVTVQVTVSPGCCQGGGGEPGVGLWFAGTFDLSSGVPVSVPHLLGTTDIIVQTYWQSQQIMVDVVIVDANTITLQAISTELLTAVRVVITGMGVV